MIPRLLLALQVVAFLTISCRACSPPYGIPTGPWLGADFDLGLSPTYLRTTASEEHELLVTIHMYDGEDAWSANLINATIDLRTGSVTKGAPKGTLTLIPQTLMDTTGGFAFVVNETAAILTSGERVIEANLEIPDGFEMDQYYFFVSSQTERAYIFYGLYIDCRDGVGNYERCKDCPTCGYVENKGIIVDLANDSVVFSGDLDIYGVSLNQPGPYNSLDTVYDNIQVAAMGGLDSCGGRDYIFYNESSVIRSRFRPGYLGALALNQTGPQDLRAFRIRQNITYEEDKTGEEFGQGMRFVTGYAIEEVDVIGGATLRSVKLNLADIWKIANWTGRPEALTSAPSTTTPSEASSMGNRTSSAPSTTTPSESSMDNITSSAPSIAPSEPLLDNRTSSASSIAPSEPPLENQTTLVPSTAPSEASQDVTSRAGRLPGIMGVFCGLVLSGYLSLFS